MSIGGYYAGIVSAEIVIVVVQLQLCRHFDLLDSVIFSTPSNLEETNSGLSIASETGINLERGHVYPRGTPQFPEGLRKVRFRVELTHAHARGNRVFKLASTWS